MARFVVSPRQHTARGRRNCSAMQSCSIGRSALALSGRATGLLLALTGTLIDSCEALVVRRMGELLEDWHRDDTWDLDGSITHRMVIFYKYAFTAVFTLLGALAATSGLWEGLRKGKRHIIAAATCQASISMLLTLSLLETETASVYLLYLLAPLWSALFGRFFLREPIRRCAFGLSTCLLLRQ